MLEALLSSLRETWPMYLVAIGGAETLLYLKNRQGRRVVIVTAAIVFLILFALSMTQGSSWALENHLLKLIAVNAISLVVPVAMITGAIFAIGRLRSAVVQHATLVGFVATAMFFFPLWGLMVVCGSGLDCL
jgi:hypothetical protein